MLPVQDQSGLDDNVVNFNPSKPHPLGIDCKSGGVFCRQPSLPLFGRCNFQNCSWKNLSPWKCSKNIQQCCPSLANHRQTPSSNCRFKFCTTSTSKMAQRARSLWNHEFTLRFVSRTLEWDWTWYSTQQISSHHQHSTKG